MSTNMKKTTKTYIYFMLVAVLTAVSPYAKVNAQKLTATQVLDKTAKTIMAKGGASASFSIANASKSIASSGTITIKGRKFHASTPQATVWFNGKTQWTYMKNTNEVNVTTPNAAKQSMMNPYTFIYIYKNGYDVTMSSSGGNHIVEMKAQTKTKSIRQMQITINKKTFVPSQIKFLQQKGGWITVNISNFKSKKVADSMFTFNSKDFPTAEVIDLR